MKTVTFIFATGDIWLDHLVVWITRSPWSHVALQFNNDQVLVETLAGRGFLMLTAGKYDIWPGKIKRITREISAAAYDEMLELAFSWNGQQVQYGYSTCLLIGVKQLLGANVANRMLEYFPGIGKDRLVCSEMIVALWRVAAPDFLAGKDPRLVSPAELFCLIHSTNVQEEVG